MLKNDRINMILALLIAIGLWVYVVGVENPEKDIIQMPGLLQRRRKTVTNHTGT